MMLELLVYTVLLLVVFPALLLGVGKAVFAFTSWGPKPARVKVSRLNPFSKRT